MEKIERLKIYIIGGPAVELAIKWNEILQNVIKGNKIPMYQNIGIDTDFLGKHAENIEIIGVIEGNTNKNSHVTDTIPFVYNKDINGIVLLSDILYPIIEQETDSNDEEKRMRLAHVAARLIPLINQHRVVFVGYNGTKTLEKLEQIIYGYLTEKDNPCFWSSCPSKNLLINPNVSSMRAFGFLLDDIVKEIMTCNKLFELQKPATELEYAPSFEIQSQLKN